jgi:hypothetical protein
MLKAFVYHARDCFIVSIGPDSNNLIYPIFKAAKEYFLPIPAYQGV